MLCTNRTSLMFAEAAMADSSQNLVLVQTGEGSETAVQEEVWQFPRTLEERQQAEHEWRMELEFNRYVLIMKSFYD
jgi:hypothetical protein